MIDRIDAYLIEEVQKGNKQAFNAIVLKYQYNVYNIINRYINNPTETMDITQETFLKAYQGIDKFRGDSALYTWLYSIAINTAKNYLIAQGRRLLEIPIDDIDMDNFFRHNNVPVEYSTPEHILISYEMESTLFNTLEHSLPVELSMAVTLRELDGLSYQEIAKIMNCPVGTIRSRIFRARETIDRNIQPFLDN